MLVEVSRAAASSLQPSRALPATCRDTQRGAAWADAGAFALEVRAVGKRESAIAVAPRERAARAGVAERFHVLTHGRRVGLVVHKAVAHADPALGHDAVVFPD